MSVWTVGTSGSGQYSDGQEGDNDRGNWAVGNGLRIYGWTTAFTVPYALAILEETDGVAAPNAGEGR